MNAEVDLSSAVLETPRLVLRAFDEKDLDDFYAYASVPDVGEWAGWKHHENKEESQRILTLFITEKKTFALVDKSSQKVIGSLGLEKYTADLPVIYDSLKGREIGYVLSKDYWGEGLMSEAVKAVIQYCFNDLKLDFLVVCHHKNNNRSRRVIEKSGFRLLGENVHHTLLGTYEATLYYILDNPKRR
jgi:[ribosomal protein S5]-alanine N-acetyltransferase